MATIRNKEYFTFDPTKWDSVNQIVTVGHNRQLRLAAPAILEGYLLGHKIISFVNDYTHEVIRVSLDDCGFPTATTRQAMSDFMRTMGINAAVSVAGGKLSADFVYKPDSVCNMGHRQPFKEALDGTLVASVPYRQMIG